MFGLKPFSYLRDLPGRYELVCVAAKHHNELDPTNPHLEFIFSSKDPDAEPQVSCGITVGYLPYLWIGQKYKKGKFHTSRAYLSQSNYFSYFIDVNKGLETTVSQIPDFRFQPMDQAGFQHLKDVPVKVFTSVGRGNITLVIPEYELIRFYYAKSDRLARAIFNGHFDKDNVSKYIINTNNESPRFIGETFRFVYRHGFSEPEIITIGRILASKKALNSAQLVHKTIQTHNINNSSHSNSYFRTDFPFDGVTELRVRGYFDRQSSGYIYFVKQILSCSGPYPFSAISCCDELSVGNPNPDGKPMSIPGKSPGTKEDKKAGSVTKGESTSTQGPDTAVKAMTTELMSTEHLGLHSITITYEKFSESTHKSEPSERPQMPEQDAEDMSTGSPKNNRSKKGKQNIVESYVPEPSEYLLNFASAVRNVQQASEAVKNIQSIPLFDGPYSSVINEYLIPFPKIPCSSISKTRIFSFIDSKYIKLRLAICFELNVQTTSGANQFFYIFNAEARQLENTKEVLPAILIYKKDLQRLPTSWLEGFLIRTIRLKAWPRPSCYQDIGIKTIHRTKKSTEMTKNISDLITSIACH